MPYAKKLRTFALVAAALLLLGTASASGAGKIGGNQIKKNAIASKHIKKNAVQSSDIKQGAVQSSEIKDGTVTSGDLKNGTVAAGDLANGSVTAAKIAPGAVTFQSSLWSTVLRNQTSAAESNVQAGPGGDGSLNEGSLRLAVSGPADLAAFGNSLEFLGIQLDHITELSYSTYNADDPPLVRPSLRIEINPHLVDDATLGGGYEFSTLTHEPAPGTTGWVTYEDALADDAWRLTGDAATETGCDQITQCTFEEIVTLLADHDDLDPAPPAISSGIYFGLGSGVTAPTETAVDAFVLNGNLFDFEPTGVFMTPAP